MKLKPNASMLKYASLLSGAIIAMPLPLLAQTDEEESEASQGVIQVEEIVVTGRKREESLQDIPVSISVLSNSSLAEQNVLSQGDLAELIPGLHYNEGNEGASDRIAALPSIRGVSSSEIATNRTKVSSFIDGIPILGSVGAINIGGAAQVEVYSGPQSAAFGRSTFAGAINYVTVDPADELTGSVEVNVSDQGTRILSGSLGGPLSDVLSFQLGAQVEDSVSPDSDEYTYTDGVESETRGGNNLSARFVFTPSDKLDVKLTFTHDETDDGPGATFYATQASAASCYESSNGFTYEGDMGTVVSADGEFDCEFERDTDAGLQAVNNIERYYNENADALQALVDAAVAAGATDITTSSGNTYTVEEAILAVAAGYSIPDEDVGSQSERDRILAQFDYLLDNDSMLQLSLMTSKEEYIRQSNPLNAAEPYEITYDADTGYYSYGDNVMGMVDVPSADPTTIDEQYAELRWASPGTDRLRWVLGGSYYEYEFVTEIFDGFYGALNGGFSDDFDELTGLSSSVADVVLSEFTENYAVFFNASYDFTDQLTGSIEGRYSSDKVGGYLPAYDITQYQTTESFTPRLGLNYAFNDGTTFYAQYAVGVNPAGINSDLLNPDAVDTLDNGIEVALDPSNPDDLTTVYSVDYDSSDYLAYDEETLTNFEVGVKGSALDGRLSYSAAMYYMIWEDAIQSINLDWDYTYANDDLAGTLVEGTTDTYYVASTDDTTARVSANSGSADTMGLELTANYFINDNWSISGNTSLMKAEYTDFCSETLYTGNGADLGAYAGLEVGQSVEGADCYVLDGKELALQPSFTLSLTPRFETQFDNGLMLSSTARIQYTSSQYLDVANVASLPATQTLNLTLGLSRDNWSATFYVENLFDDVTYEGAGVLAAEYLANYPDNTTDTSLYFADDAYSTYTYTPETGRSVGVRASYRF